METIDDRNAGAVFLQAERIRLYLICAYRVSKHWRMSNRGR